MDKMTVFGKLVLGVGCWVLGAGCWVLGTGYWVLGTWYWVLGKVKAVCCNGFIGFYENNAHGPSLTSI